MLVIFGSSGPASYILSVRGEGGGYDFPWLGKVCYAPRRWELKRMKVGNVSGTARTWPTMGWAGKYTPRNNSSVQEQRCIFVHS
jgi:hypothetical protein